MINFKWFGANDDLSDSYSVRRKVFIEEQQIDEKAEFDGSDKLSTIVVVYVDNFPVATGRLIVKNDCMMLGRIAVLKEQRGKNYGAIVVKLLVNEAFNKGYDMQYIHAQTQAIGFYQRLGFVKYGNEFIEDGIPHYNMKHVGNYVYNFI